MTSILVVDDEPDIRLMLRFSLAGDDRELFFAANGTEALEMARSLEPDLVVLDYRLPDVSGTDVARQLAASGFAGRVLVFSAQVTEELDREVAALGLTACSKTDIPRLLQLVAEAAA